MKNFYFFFSKRKKNKEDKENKEEKENEDSDEDEDFGPLTEKVEKIKEKES